MRPYLLVTTAPHPADAANAKRVRRPTTAFWQALAVSALAFACILAALYALNRRIEASVLADRSSQLRADLATAKRLLAREVEAPSSPPSSGPITKS